MILERLTVTPLGERQYQQLHRALLHDFIEKGSEGFAKHRLSLLPEGTQS